MRTVRTPITVNARLVLESGTSVPVEITYIVSPRTAIPEATKPTWHGTYSGSAIALAPLAKGTRATLELPDLIKVEIRITRVAVSADGTKYGTFQGFDNPPPKLVDWL